MIATENIKFVKELTLNGTTYAWYVSIKGNDSHTYIHRENRKTVAREYGKNRLPKAVQRYIDGRQREIFTTGNDDTFITYIYR